MFTETDGPTALRADLVFGLAFSRNAVWIGPDGERAHCCAALAAVWNGTKGYVAVLLRHLNEERVRRYVGDEPAASVEALERAIAEAVAFAESMGFFMDSPDFRDLDEAARAGRVQAWNDVRKPPAWPRHLPGPDVSPPSLAPPEPGPPRTPERPAIAQATAPPASARPAPTLPTPDDPAGGAYLGRIPIVRRRASDGADPNSRLFTHF